MRLILEDDFEDLGSVADGRTLLRDAQRLDPEIVLLDIPMPMLSIEATRQIRQLLPGTRVIVLTMYADVTYAAQALEAGVSGYVLKTCPPEEIKTALRRVLAGDLYVTPAIAKVLAPFLSGSSRHRLTPRQREVLQLLAEGRTGEQIADVLSMSPGTVEFHKYG